MNLRSVMEKNYTKKTIKIDHLGAGTISVMEWIRDNGCPDLRYTDFVDAGGSDIVMVSRVDICEIKGWLDNIDTRDENPWFEYKGMKRTQSRFVRGIWLFLIDGNYYYASR